MTDHLRDIVGSDGEELKGRTILLAVTGSVSAYRSPDIARILMRHGADVVAVVSEMTEQIIHPNLLEWATGNPVITKLTGRVQHVELTTGPTKADLLLIAPCTANTISKIASGIDDTPVTSCVSSALGANIPLVVAPAMHDTMYAQPIVQENIRKLTALGVVFVEPTQEEGKSKLASPERILSAVINSMPPKDYTGLKILITAGPTIEHIDPVRIITNPSTGKMGAALAFEAISRKASVTIIHGPVQVPLPIQAKRISVQSTREMYDRVMEEILSTNYDVVVATAAPADYAPAATSERKISTADNSRLILELGATPKIVDDIKKIRPHTFLLAFRAQSNLSRDELVSDASDRLKRASADLIAVNDVGRDDIGFGSDFNEIILLDQTGETKVLNRRPKRLIARMMLDEVSRRLKRDKLSR
jgi:phosphopantothenoylcysteine decarboxylase/phosphopantothenate--cysteine ligase